MIILSCGSLEVELCHPGEYYQGTRFDRAGVFRRIVKDGYVYADEWFDHQDPYRHDRVCGLSEEFVTNQIREGLLCKIGVGLLRIPQGEPYDRFKLYEIAEEGSWSVENTETEAIYRHILPGWYSYVKRIVLKDADTLKIAHMLEWKAETPFNGYSYNHNFLTFNNTPVGPGRRVEFPWKPEARWRHHYNNAGFEGNAIAFYGPVSLTDSVFCDCLKGANGESQFNFIVKEGVRAVHIQSQEPVQDCVFWSNPRVACIEPYISLDLNPGTCANWCYCYRFL